MVFFTDIVKLVDWYIYKDYYVIVMEYLEGYEDMVRYVNKHGCIEEKHAKDLFKKVSGISMIAYFFLN